MTRRARTAVIRDLLLLVLAGTAGSCGDGQTPASGGRRPNVLLVSVDMLRSDHLGCYGHAHDTSPTIDALAREGVLFESHISSTSWTLPAHAALFTSLADSVHGCTDTDRRLADERITLAERFRDAGYRTMGIYSGPYLHPAFGLGQGFEEYIDCMSYAGMLDPDDPSSWSMAQDVMHRSHEDVTSSRVLEAFEGWLARRGDEPFFAFVHMWDPHFDFIPPPPYDTRFDPDYTGSVTGRNFFFDPSINPAMPERDKQHLLALYDGEIAWTDMHLGRMLDALRERGLLDDTIVAVTSDHGTEFFEHGGKGHRMTLFDEVIRVPLVVRYPRGLPAGRRVTTQTRSLDVGPTLLDLAGLGAPTRVMGSSLVGLARARVDAPDEPAVSELFSVGRRMRVLRTRAWKFFDVQHDGRQGFVDLTLDPGERKIRTNLSQQPARGYLERYRKVCSALDTWREIVGAGESSSEIPPEVLRTLDALGYTSR